jgi:hypothetical protein
MIPDDLELGPEEPTGYRPGPLTVLITLLVILALLTSLLGPLFYTGVGRRPTPTPIPTFLLEAWAPPVILPLKLAVKSKEPFITMKGSPGCKGSLLLNFVGGGFSLEPSAQPNPIFVLLAPLRL